MSFDPWLENYDAACRLAQDITETIHERNTTSRNGGNPAKLNMKLRASLQKLKQNIGLLRTSDHKHILQAEADRRLHLLDQLSSRESKLNASFRAEDTPFSPVQDLKVNPWLVNESEETRGLSFGEIQRQQQHIVEAQDAGLEALASVISRQKHMGQEINNELEQQNEVIDDITHLVAQTDGRIRNEEKRVKLLEVKSSSCGMLLLIVLLLIAIIVVAVWPTS